MANPYARLQASARRLINKYGRTVSIRVLSYSGQQQDPNVSPTDTPVKAVVVTEDGSHDVQSEQFMAEFTLFSEFDITPDMEIVDGTVVYSILNVEKVAPGDTTILFIIKGVT